jgi:hypothetical protein
MTTDASAGLTRSGTPTARAASDCAKWLQACKDMGWPKTDMPALCDLWWRYHDNEGWWITPPPEPDSCDALLADLRGKLAAMTDNRDVLVGQLQAAREHVEAERAKVREMHVEMQSAADLLLAINKRFHKRDPFAVTAIDMWLAKRALPASVDAKGADRG